MDDTSESRTSLTGVTNTSVHPCYLMWDVGRDGGNQLKLPPNSYQAAKQLLSYFPTPVPVLPLREIHGFKPGSKTNPFLPQVPVVVTVTARTGHATTATDSPSRRPRSVILVEHPQIYSNPHRTPTNYSNPLRTPTNIPYSSRTPTNYSNPLRTPTNIQFPHRAPTNYSNPLRTPTNIQFPHRALTNYSNPLRTPTNIQFPQEHLQITVILLEHPQIYSIPHRTPQCVRSVCIMCIICRSRYSKPHGSIFVSFRSSYIDFKGFHSNN